MRQSIHQLERKMDLKKCCCCIDLRLGCKIIAILGFIADAAMLAAIGSAGYNKYVLIPGNVIGMLGCICLLYGAFTSHKTAVALYLIADAIKIVLLFVFGIWGIVIASISGLAVVGIVVGVIFIRNKAISDN